LHLLRGRAGTIAAGTNSKGDAMRNTLFAALALMGAATAFAQQGNPPADSGKAQPSFAERKQHILERMDQRIAQMQKARDCLANAQDENAARACRQTHGPMGGPEGGAGPGAKGPGPR
jgi:hypothetical protein